MFRYLALLGLPLLLLGVFFATGSVACAAVFLASLGAYLLYASADRLIHYKQRSLSRLELSWFAYLVILLVAIMIAATRYREYDTAGALRFLAAIGTTSGMMLLLPAAIPTRRALHICILAFDVIGILIAVTVFLSLIGVGSHEGDHSMSASGAHRYFGIFGDSVAFAISLFVCRSWIAKKWFSFGFHLMALLVTAGIGGSLTLGVALAGHALLPWRRSTTEVSVRSRRLISTVVASLLALMIIAVFGSQLAIRLQGPALMSFTVAGRFATYQVASEIIESSPIIGIGPTAFEHVAARLAPESLYAVFNTAYIATAQNQTLQALCDSGVIGLGSLIAFLACLLRSASASSSAAGSTGRAFRAYQMWLLGLVLGNQSATWLLPFSIVPVLVFAIGGLSLAEAWLRGADCVLTKPDSREPVVVGRSGFVQLEPTPTSNLR